MLDLSNYWIYDIETYKHLFCVVFTNALTLESHIFEISKRKDNSLLLLMFLDKLHKKDNLLVGFNNLNFDYPVLHGIIHGSSKSSLDIYECAQNVINSMKEDRFGKTIPKEEIYIHQVDLFKMHHFDNTAKSTSLKILEFNMKMDTIQDLPYSIEKELTYEEMDEIIRYNINDVLATLKFFKLSIESLELRKRLSEKYNSDFTNYSDSKIGSEIFINELEKVKKGSCYNFFNGRRVAKQTKRKFIDFSDITLPYIKFKRPEFQAIHEWFKNQVIEETKGVFSDIPEHKLGEVAKYCNMVTKKSKKMNHIPSQSEINAFLKDFPLGWVENKTAEQKYSKKDGKPLKTPEPNYYFCWRVLPSLSVIINGHEYIYGTGGIHSSVESQVVYSDDNYLIIDLDVESYYPNLSILHNIYPEHLSQQFCRTYKDLFEERKRYPKGSSDNLAIKLALNSTYGNSNNKFSPFYDPKYTMKITVNGQLSLCMLIERILELPEAISIQSNTDGITMKIRKEDSDKLNEIVAQWEKETKFKMERNDYSVMYIRDVNNYVSKYLTSGKVKLKGAYAYDLEQHKNHSALIVKKAVAQHLETGENIEDIIRNHKDKYDFMLRTKIPRNFKLILKRNEEEIEQQRVTRYYASTSNDSGELFKIMPPKEGSNEIRVSGIQKGQKVKICNNIVDFKWDIDYNYYIEQAKKLLDVFNTEEDEE